MVSLQIIFCSCAIFYVKWMPVKIFCNNTMYCIVFLFVCIIYCTRLQSCNHVEKDYINKPELNPLFLFIIANLFLIYNPDIFKHYVWEAKKSMIIKDSDNTASHGILGHEFPELNSSPLSSILAQENTWNLGLCGHDPFSNSKCNLPWSNSTKDWLRPLNTLLNLHAPCLQNDAGRRCDSVHSLFLSFIPHLSWNTVMVEGWISFEKDSILYALWQQDDDSSSTNLSHGHLHISPCSPLGKRRAIQEGEREREN